SEASGSTDSTVQLTWLDGRRYYTITTATGPESSVLFGRTGAADPNFNLVSEPMMIVRRAATDQVFASAIEPHGFFSELEERSADARGVIRDVRVVASTNDGTVVRIAGDKGLEWIVMVNNGPASATAVHRVGTYEWTGNFSVKGVASRP